MKINKNNQKLISLTIMVMMTVMSILFRVQFLYAQDENSSSNKIDKEIIKQKLKERLDNIKEGEIDVVETITSNNKLYTYFGEINSATESAIIVNNIDDTTSKINVSNDTNLYITGKNNKKITIEFADIEKGWFAIAIGKFTDDKVLEAQDISFFPTYTRRDERIVISGKITEIEDDFMNIKNDSEYIISIPKKISIKIEGVDNATIKDLIVEDHAIAVISSKDNPINTNDKNKREDPDYDLKAIYILPSINNPIANEDINEATDTAIATDSAKDN